uniref:NADH-ubiquinone oxidoreductase chain 2 n=1 Tax=Ricinoides karschii TaxID=1238228 RepID=W5R4L5_9ARAC|nr:NADH dehydrogenase subunit 2 [Ricinoides karschii]AGL11958.1 NADH dehydrogenase subunit 2 [Ricinoides karschii]
MNILPLNLSLMVSITMIISSTSWFHMWLSLEINLVCFIGTVLYSNMFHEAMIKYFLTQAMGSSLFIMGYMTSPIFMDLHMITAAALMIKLGLVPFHFWYPEVMNMLSWHHCLILSTLQKFGPLTLLFNLNMNLIMFGILSTIVSSLMSINQSSLRKLLSFSSISHNGWMLVAISYQSTLWWVYFFIYSIINILIMIALMNLNWYHINQIEFTNTPFMITWLIGILALGGLPPTVGFVPKWLILSITSFHSYLITMILIFSSLIILFAYLMMLYKPLIMMHNQQKLNFNNSKDNSSNWSWILLLTLPTIPLSFS